MEGKKLQRVETVKYLGIYIDDTLSWNYQVKQLSKKLSRSNGILAKLRHYTKADILTQVYYSICYSYMVYGCTVWSLTSANNIHIINILQKKCMRILNFADSHTNDFF